MDSEIRNSLFRNDPHGLSPMYGASGARSGNGLKWLIAAAIATVILWQLPFGNYILYPFTILSVWFHEMAHGIMAMLLGGSFVKLEIYPNGSGVAFHQGPLFLGRIGRALTAAAGPMGPPLAGAAMIIASRSSRGVSLSLIILGSALLLSTLLWVRSFFGFFAVPLMGCTVLLIAFRGSESVKAFAVQFLGVQACVSAYRQLDYVFSYTAGSLRMISDTGQMQQMLFLPYWFWGAVITVFSFGLLAVSLRIAYRP